MFIIFDVKESVLAIMMAVIILCGGYAVAKTIFAGTQRDDLCVAEESVFYPSPDKRWYAKLNVFICAASPDKVEVFLLRKPDDRIRLLVYSSVYESKQKMHIAWKGSNDLVLSIANGVTPDFPAKRYAGVNVSYSMY